MTTTRKGNLTIKNFGNNKGAMINYYNNIRNQEYVEMVIGTYDVAEKGYCVEIVYKNK